MMFGKNVSYYNDDTPPEFSKNWKICCLNLLYRVRTTLGSGKAHPIDQHLVRTQKTLELLQEDWELDLTFDAYTSDIVKALSDNPKSSPELKPQHLKMLFENKKGDLVAQAVVKTLEYMGFVESNYPDKYDYIDILDLYNKKRIEIEGKATT